MFPPIETSVGALIAVAVLGYALGSVPFGVLVARLMNLGNLREIGSGNIGATNVLRTGNKFAALLTLLLDAGKGAFAVILAGHFYASDAAALAGFWGFLGQIHPVWLRYRGGKGVATGLGLILALGFWAGLGACATWLSIAFLPRDSLLAARTAAASTPGLLVFVGPRSIAGPAVLLATLIWFRHRENIERLLGGTETKIGARASR